MKLLVEQMKHQSPTDPADGQAWINQMTQFSMLEQMQQQSAGQVEGQRGRLPGQDGLLAGRQGAVRPGRRRADRLQRQGAHPHRRRPCRREGRRSQRPAMTPLSHNPALVPPVGAPAPVAPATAPRTAPNTAPNGPSFADVLGEKAGAVQLSGHAKARIERRGISLGSRDPRPPAERRRPRRCQGLTGVRRPRGRRGLRRVREGQNRDHRGRSRLDARSRLHQHRFRRFFLTHETPHYRLALIEEAGNSRKELPS